MQGRAGGDANVTTVPGIHKVKLHKLHREINKCN